MAIIDKCRKKGLQLKHLRSHGTHKAKALLRRLDKPNAETKKAIAERGIEGRKEG